MHQPYEKELGHPADFRVTYRFYDIEEGGRQTIPYQGYRSDFWYEHPDNPKPKSGRFQVFMIWPEFESADGKVILDNTKSVDKSGTARMWVVFRESRASHIGKIEIGLRGYFMEGSKRVAECTVVEMTGLKTNLDVEFIPK